jgi:hypothetical protein
MNIDYKDICHRVGMSEEGFINWTQAFEFGYVFFEEDDLAGCVYTDGDEGFMLFESECEIFGTQGVRVTIGGGYCDIDFNSMQDIINRLSAAESMVAL